ncbi:MAG TPA: CBS domain-containing protein [Flavilitoribacter sp.]|nr:CBS domain-containing protein [Flavilitoribacter sp.]HMQ89348.1 CBS domain-containing protein [Flavilitoribacter sp.]
MFNKFIKVAEIMTTGVVTVSPDDLMEKVAVIFKSNPIHHIPVVRNGKVEGIISKGDFNKLEHHFTLFKNKSSKDSNFYVMHSILASEVMTRPVVTVSQDDTLDFAAGILRENLFHCLPVVDKNKQLTGIITPYDLMNYAYRDEPLGLS